MRLTTRPALPGWWLTYPNLIGAIVPPYRTGALVDTITNTRGVLSGSVPPTWDHPQPGRMTPTLLFTQGASLNSYVGFDSKSAFVNLGVNTPMTLIARIKWTGGKGGIAERCGASTTGWAWGVGSNNRLVFIKRQSLDRQCREAATSLTSGSWQTVAVTYEGEAAGVNGGSIKNYLDGVLLADSNVRTGVGVNASDAAEAFRLGNSTIDFPGVGNPTMAGSFGGNIAWLFGFNRVLSALEIKSFGYVGNEPADLIYTAPPRRARFLFSLPPDGFKIDGSSRDILQHWTINTHLNERSTMNFGVKSMDGSYRPGLREEIDFRKFSIHFFAGHIHHTDEAGLGGYGVVPIVTQCGATDFKALADRRKVTPQTIPAGTLKSQILELAEPLEVYGVTVHDDQVDGPSMPDLALTGGSIFEAFQKLSVQSGYAFDIDYDKRLRMFAPGIEDAPFNIEDGDSRVKGDVRVSPTTVDYGNHITVRFTVPAEKAFVYFIIDNNPSDDTTFKVAGKDFVFKLSPTDPNHVQIGATINDTYNNFVGAVDPLDEVTAFNQTTRVDVYAAESGSAGNSIQVESNDLNGGADFHWGVDGVAVASHLYYGSDDALTGVVVAEDVPAQEGGANLYEKVYDEPTVRNEEAAQALADGYLARSLVQPREIRYRTRLHGLRVGMKQHIEVPGRNVDADCLITQIDISPEGSALLNYDVTAIEGQVIVASHQEKWRRMGRPAA